MRIKFQLSLIGIGLCLFASFAGVFYYLYLNCRTKAKISSVKYHDPDVPDNIYDLDDYSIALSELERIEKYIKSGQSRKAMKRHQSFFLVFGRLTNEQRDKIKHRMLDLTEPVFRKGEPLVAAKICSYACLQPTGSPSSLRLANRIADMAEIIINRLKNSRSEAIYKYSHITNYFLNTSMYMSREVESESDEKKKLTERIAQLKKQFSDLYKNPSPGK